LNYLYGIEILKDDPVDTCDLCSGYGWWYQKCKSSSSLLCSDLVCVHV